jgi:hypothetical protein
MKRGTVNSSGSGRVEPKPEWIGLIPSGVVRSVVRWGNFGVVYLKDSILGFAAYVFTSGPH